MSLRAALRNARRRTEYGLGAGPSEPEIVAIDTMAGTVTFDRNLTTHRKEEDPMPRDPRLREE